MSAGKPGTNAKLWGWLCLLLVGLGGLAWCYRSELQVRYRIWQVSRLDEAQREQWAERLATHEQTALPALWALLEEDDPQKCACAELALRKISTRWVPNAPERLACAHDCVERWRSFSSTGQQHALSLLAFLVKDGPAQIRPLACKVFQSGSQQTPPENRLAALQLAGALLLQDPAGEMAQLCRVFVAESLQDGSGMVRARAAHVAQLRSLELLPKVVPLLRDPEPEVRRAALATVGPHRELVENDDLLPWLRDEDEQVRQLCAAALSGRGISEEGIRVAKQMLDPAHGVRLQAIQDLVDTQEFDPTQCLLRLSHDPYPSVRLAAIHAATVRSSNSLTERMIQMAENDPSLTVRQLTHYYLSLQN